MKRKQRSYTGLILLMAAVVAVIGIVVFIIDKTSPSKERADLSACFSLTDSSNVGLTVDGLISNRHGKLIDGEIFFDLETVTEAINKRLYYDEAEQLIAVTTPTVYRTFSLDELRNEGKLIEKNGTTYLLLSFIEEWTDMETVISEEPKRVTIQKTWPYETAQIFEETKVRTKASIKGDILYDALQGDVLILPKTDEVLDGWTRVSTTDGLSGYVETKCLMAAEEAGTDHVSRIGVYTSLSMDEKVNLVFYATNNDTTNSNLLGKLDGVTGVNVVSPTWFFLDGPGEVRSLVDADITAELHNKGYQVWALLNDFDGSACSREETLTILKSTSSRRAIIDKIMAEALAAGIDGINIDIELLEEECGPAYLSFIREMSVECRNNGLFLSVDTTVPLTWSYFTDRREQGIVADYVIVMCYDEHYRGSDKAGSVASLSFHTSGIDKTLQYVPAEKLIASIPFYTRLWETKGDTAPDSRLMTMDEAASYAAENSMEIYRDEEAGQNIAEVEKEGILYQIWMEDTYSVGQRMEVIKDRALGGVAEWDLGSQNNEVWPLISSYLS